MMRFIFIYISVIIIRKFESIKFSYMETSKNILSIWFLLYAKKIPLEIFWNEYSFLQNFQKNKDNCLNICLLYFLVFTAYILSFALAFSPVVWLSNLLVSQFFSKSFLLFFLKNKNGQADSRINQRLNQIIVWINLEPQKKLFLGLINFFQLTSLLIIFLGANEVYNSFFSHSTPDLFDFFFPENGTTFFWGGLTFLNFSFFMQDFLIRSDNLKSSNQRKRLAQKMPLNLRKIVAI